MIKTKRCYLRPYKKEDLNLILNFHKENQHFLKPWEPKYPDNFLTDSYWEAKIKSKVDAYHKKQALPLLILDHDQKELRGFIHFGNFEYEPFLNCRLGYKLGEEFQAKGYMQESLSAAIDYIFNETNIRRIEANYMPGNKRSAALLEKLGFQVHGIATRYLQINGVWEDHCLSSLLKPKF